MGVAMRHYLLDLVDRDRAAKRPRVSCGSTRPARPIRRPTPPASRQNRWTLAIDALRLVDPRQADVVELRIMGLSNDEIAGEVGIAVATVKRDLKQARAFLAFQLGLHSTWLDT